MPVIYQPKGRALEYAKLACNHYSGCSHGCVYCYAPNMLHMDRNDFHAMVTPRKDIIKKIEREAPKHKGETVLLSFICDPYCIENDTYRTTRFAIEALHNAGVNVCILTKGGMRSVQDIELFTENDQYATTLTTLINEVSRRWEPNAAFSQERINALKMFHAEGIYTWVSLEPVLYVDQAYDFIRITHSFVDHYKVGKLNYHPHGNTIDWRKFAVNVVKLLDEFGCNYNIKQDLREYLESE